MSLTAAPGVHVGEYAGFGARGVDSEAIYSVTATVELTGELTRYRAKTSPLRRCRTPV